MSSDDGIIYSYDSQYKIMINSESEAEATESRFSRRDKILISLSAVILLTAIVLPITLILLKRAGKI